MLQHEPQAERMDRSKDVRLHASACAVDAAYALLIVIPSWLSLSLISLLVSPDSSAYLSSAELCTQLVPTLLHSNAFYLSPRP